MLAASLGQRATPFRPVFSRMADDEAARALSALRSDDARAALRGELAGPRARRAAWGIANCVDPRLVPELIALARDPDVNTRIAATRALARSHDPAGLAACRGYDDHFTRQYLAEAHDPSLAALADDPKNAELVAYLRAPGTAAKLIGWCRAGSVGPDVFRMARDQEAADWLLNELEAAPEPKAPIQDTRAMLLGQALASLPDPAPVIPRLCAILRKASRERVGWMSREIWECARGDARWLEVAAALADAGASLAPLNLGDMRDPRATATLIAHRPSSVGDLGTYCLALENDASPAAVAELTALLDHADPWVRQGAARSLAHVGDPIAVAAVERAFARAWAPGKAAINTPAGEEQFATAYALAVIDGEAALPQLLPRAGEAKMLLFAVAHACARPEPLLRALPGAKDPAARAAIVKVLRAEFFADARVAALPDPPEPDPRADDAPPKPAKKAGDF
jgi:HEAT repeat protein